ncbi:Aim3p SKDI_02G2160 [Saccharomyces kudriavzevii IFO 1802]|uniref:Altered inheritance of mitochondria protein 3 n=1 Tax=Saccharomyces kudriavzevii (strain ATCC MYA-4449 / AS 2.2408 / CBS 8840 / NBRC 1802 / NCYC 2889) TaxID=226230 RepID=A0AA35NME6_SACK1|nr:uncharacterized protein SKDI_02G2160 [Saccharomyces kudriavzevii IFO 1802]CAI4055515.1 hypothetical protein SKDI_02G2160 [Saccharomyces kudriavzevii IFO 1802]
MGFWENNKDSITSGLKSAGKYGYQGTKYVAKTGYKASKKHYNSSKSHREKKNGKKKSSDEEYESDEEEYERKPADIRTLKNPNSFPPPPLKPGQRTFTGQQQQQQQQQMSSGQPNYASQGVYQDQPGTGPMGQPQQYAQYPQQQQAPMAQQMPAFGPQGQQMPPYGSNSNPNSFQSLPQQSQPQNAIQSQASSNSGSQQNTGFPLQNPQYGSQSANPAPSQPFQNNLQYQQQQQQQYQQQQQQQQPAQFRPQGPQNFEQSQFPSNPQQMDQPQQQSSSQFVQQVLPPPVQPQQYQQQPLPAQPGQSIVATPRQSASNGFDQQQQQQQQPPNQGYVPSPYGNQFNTASAPGIDTYSPAYGQPVSHVTDMQGVTSNYGAPPIQTQPPLGGQPPVPVRMQSQSSQVIPRRSTYQSEASFGSSESTPHFEVTPFDPDAPAPKPRIDIATVDVNNLPPPPTHRDRGAVVKPESTPSVESSSDATKKTLSNVTSSPAVSLPPRNSKSTTTNNELNSNKRDNGSTVKSSILGHYDVEINMAPPPKPFRHESNFKAADHARKVHTPEQKLPTPPSRGNIEPSSQSLQAKSETIESVSSINPSKPQEIPISNFVPPPKPFRHVKTQQNQGGGLPPMANKNDALPASPYDQDKNVGPSLLPQSKPQLQSQSGPVRMETHPIQNFQPPPKPYRPSIQERISTTDNGGTYSADENEANNGRGRGRIVKHGVSDEYHSKSETSPEKYHVDRLEKVPACFPTERASSPPTPPKFETENIKGPTKYENLLSPSTAPVLASGSTKKAPPPIVKPKPKDFSLNGNEAPKQLDEKATTGSLKGSGQDERLNSITNELSHFKLRKTNVKLEDLGNPRDVKDLSPVNSDLDEKYVSASGSISPPKPPSSRASKKKVPPAVPRKNDNLKKRPPMVPKKKVLLRSLEPRPINMKRTDSRDKSDDDDDLNPFERYKRNVVPQEEDRLHK